MKYFFKIILIITFVLFFKEVKANTLFESLNSAYVNNPKLNAERASMRASREEKRGSVSEFLPSITISGYVSEQDNTKTIGSESNLKPAEQSMLVEQKIFAMIDYYIFMKIPNFNMVFKWRLLQENKLRRKSRYRKKIMSYNEIKRFIMFYQRITLQMIKDLSKSASVVMFLKKNQEIKKLLFR